jgi:hypothetical protein
MLAHWRLLFLIDQMLRQRCQTAPNDAATTTLAAMAPPMS